LASLIARLRERKLVQWMLAYLAGAWLIFQALEAIAGPWGIPDALRRGIHILLVAGFFLALVLAWYHGEKGRQRVSGPELVMIAALCAIAAGVLRFVGGAAGPAVAEANPLAVKRDRPGVAVLPFANLSPSPEDAYFADGLHEDILNQLAKVGSLDVLARQSVLKYRDSDLGIREIGRELSADAVLEGTVQREGDRLRVTAQLIDCASEAHLWSEQYDEDLSVTGVFSIQSNVARQVARAMHAILSPEEAARIDEVGTQDLTAYVLFQKARSAPSPEEGIRSLKLALEHDPGFAAAYALLADFYVLSLALHGWELSWADSARLLAEKAIALAPEQGAGYFALGGAYVMSGRMRAAIQATREGLARAPNHRDGVWRLARTFLIMDQLPEGVESARRAVALYPADTLSRSTLVQAYLDLGLRPHAERELAALAELAPEETGWLRPRIALLDGDTATALALARSEAQGSTMFIDVFDASWVAALAGDFQASLELAEQAEGLAGSGSGGVYIDELATTLGLALLKTGREEEGTQRLRSGMDHSRALIAAGFEWTASRWNLARSAAALGDRAGALEWASKALDAGFTTNPRYIELDPAFASLHGDPEFERILDQIHARQQEMARRVLELDAGSDS